jgi:regulator of nonsense transcripts 1
VAHVNLPGSDMFKKLRQLKAEKQGLSVADERQFSRLRRQLENTLLEHADVVCTTCVGAGDPRLLSFRFQHVLVDESTQASEAEALIPLTLGAKQVRPSFSLLSLSFSVCSCCLVALKH